MATQENLNRVQELYVAYYGRPADSEGQEYWADRLEAEGEGAIINAFGNSEEYAELSEGQGNATLVNSIYEQAFGRDADPEGLAYYTGVLASGEKTLAEIATTIINAASGVDLNEFNAKIEAAAEYTADFGSAEDYDLVAAKEVVANAEGGLYTPELTPAVEAYQAAQQAVSDYLQDEVAANETIAENLEAIDEPTDAQIEAALTAELDAAVGEVNAEAEAGFALSDTASVAAAQIAAQKEAYAEAVTDAEATVAETTGLQAAINSLLAAEGRFETALKAELATNQALVGEAARASTLNAGTVNADVDAATDALATYDDGATVIDLLVANTDGEVVLADGLNASDYEGLDALIEAAQAQYDAEQQVAVRTESFEEAAERVINLEKDIEDADVVAGDDYSIDATTGEVTITLNGGVDTAPNAQALLDAETDVADFDEAVEAYEELAALQNQDDDLNDAVDEAAEAFAEMDVELQVAGDNADTGNDLFIFDAETYAAATIADFGADGEDQIYIGDSFTRVDVAADETLATDDLGDNSVLEVFFKQGATGAEISFENSAFAGNVETGFDGATITLTGVNNIDDLQLENGYISIA
tara:strand:- start:2332 stop:4104 length:1773 start_codon:yes stop_codon:yes gene_type:complete